MSRSILQDMREIVWAAAPELQAKANVGVSLNDEDRALYAKLWADIRPVKYGNTATWNSANTYNLALYQVPRHLSNIVLRVDCYVVNWTAAAVDLGQIEPPPEGFAYWQYQSTDGTNVQGITDIFMQTQVMLNAEEYLVFSGGNDVALVGNFEAPPDADLRKIHTVVYSYNCGSAIIDRIGSNQAVAQITSNI